MAAHYTRQRQVFVIILSGIILFYGCKGKDKDAPKTEPPPVMYKTDTSKPVAGDPQQPPIINITDTISIKRVVLVMKDSAKTSERIGIKMSNIYNKVLPAIIKQQKLQVTGPRMAWYRTSSPPFFFEAGLPVNKKPAKLPKNVYIKNMNADSSVVAHFYGPYALTFQAYEALNDWMKSYRKRSAGTPYEIYIGEMFDSAGKPADPYRVRTDIVFPHR
jgi:effector-binding domain-containing protein